MDAGTRRPEQRDSEVRDGDVFEDALELFGDLQVREDQFTSFCEGNTLSRCARDVEATHLE